MQDPKVFGTPVKFTFQAMLHKDLTSAGSRSRDPDEVSVNSKWEGIQQVACTCSFCPWVRWIHELLKKEGEEVRHASSSNQLELDLS